MLLPKLRWKPMSSLIFCPNNLSFGTCIKEVINRLSLHSTSNTICLWHQIQGVKKFKGFNLSIKHKACKELHSWRNIKVPKVFPTLPSIVPLVSTIEKSINNRHNFVIIGTWQPNFVIFSIKVDPPKIHNGRINSITQEKFQGFQFERSVKSEI